MGTESRARCASVIRFLTPAFRPGFVASRVSWLTLLLLTALPLRIAAAVDMTGGWYLGVDSDPAVLVYLSQTASTLRWPADPTGLSTGTIDSATGAFTLALFMFGGGFPQQCGVTFQGQVDPSGNTFTGTGAIVITPPDCHSISCACSGGIPAAFRGSRSPCGNGTVDPGEQCDDGNLGRGGDCCALGCTVRPDGSDCSDGLFCNGPETTCQSGMCQRGAPPCPLKCNEATDTCFAGCPFSPSTCRTAGKSQLLVKDDGKNKLVWKWTQGAATTQTEFADPRSATDYALCIYGNIPGPLDTIVIPADATKWRTASTTGFKYKDPSATADGTTKVQLAGSTQNKSKVQIMGKGAGLPFIPFPVPAPVTVQLFNATTGLCWGATFQGSQILRNDTGQLKAKAP